MVSIALPLLFYTRESFPLTRISYYLIFIHSVILVVGAHYTYARVPLGFWMQDGFDFSRNHYDRIGHLAQGFIPAILAREILWRKQVLNVVSQSNCKGWLFFLTTCFSWITGRCLGCPVGHDVSIDRCGFGAGLVRKMASSSNGTVGLIY